MLLDAFCPFPQATLTVAAGAAAVASTLPAGEYFEVQNPGTGAIYFETGAPGIAATSATGTPLLGGAARRFRRRQGETVISIIAPGGAQSVYVTGGVGNTVRVRGRGGKAAGPSGPVAIFDAPLTTTLVPVKAGDPTFTFTRATTAYVQDQDGILRNAVSGEARFQGARRVRNLFSATATLSTQTPTVVAGLHVISFTGTGTITYSGVAAGSLVGQGAGVRVATAPFTTTAGGLVCTVTGSVTLAQLENVDGQSNTAPGEYVSVGVLAAPFNGAGVDGVKYFATTNGNSVPVANLVLQSQTFDVATWGKQNAPITPNTQVAPDGTTTGDTFTDTATNSGHRVFQAGFGIPSGLCTASVYLKAGTLVWSQLYADDGATIFFANFNLATGTLGQKSATANSTITPVGGGWYRCTVTFPSGGGTGSMAIFSSNSDVGNDSPSYAGTGKTMFLWGAQYVGGSVAGSYTPTTTTQSVASNVVNEAAGAAIPAASLLGYVAENQATNLCLQSQTLGTAPWTNENNTLAADAQTAPDGSLTGDVFTDSATNTTHRMYNGAGHVYTNGQPYTASIYLKRGTLTWFQLQLTHSVLAWANFNLATGVVGNINLCTAKIEALSNGWYRCSVSITAGSTAGNIILSGLLADTIGANPTYVGSGQTMYLWGAQVEQASDPSSYVPTTTATVTRNVDLLAYQVSANADGALGSSYAETYLPADSVAAQKDYLKFSAFSFFVQTFISAKLNLYSTGPVATANSRLVGTVNKGATAWGGSTASACLNGGVAATGAFTSVGIAGQFYVGNNGSTNALTGSIRNVRFYATRLADAALQAMTA
jgi:hypothetical protein